ncbi:MAG: winged helix DNA-binding domain-containing protein, partial [Rubrobacteraceae bacterium]|nr:winged helix DNA-binding domain-containing protein [Rubrobacteraceae bacterium]
MSAVDRVLTLRELNRATLARQMLLDRQAIPVLDAVERLAGLQAQVTSPPYVGLWTRLRDFRREDLTRLMEERQVVRATLMRATLHLMTAEDYLLLRPALQPALTRSMNSIAGKRLDGLDVDRLVGAAREYFEREPHPFADLRPLLSELEPDRDPSALAYAVRTSLPLVQVPSGGVWGYSGKAPFTTAERWLGRALSGSEDPRRLVLKYLAAFGPATVRDVQTWSGRMQLKQPVEELRAELRTFRDERGNELLDLPDAALPP